jgi:general secretion pathway protein D
LILSDWGTTIDRVMKIINQLDVPGFEEQLEVVPIKFAKAKDLADLVDKIVNKGQNSNRSGGGITGGFGGGVPSFNNRSSSGASSQKGTSYFMAIPEERTNSIIIVGNKPGIERVKKLIARLDNRIKIEDQGGVFVYHVKHGDAKKIAQVLQGVAKDAAP